MEVEPIYQVGTGHKVGDHMTVLFDNGDTENLTALLGFEYGFAVSVPIDGTCGSPLG